MSVHLVIPDVHAHPKFDNSRADLLSKLIIDVQPDVVINLGDGPDMASLSSYDKGYRSFYGKTYKADVAAFNDFEERLWRPIKKRKKRLPRRVYLEGNHDRRIEKALDLSPELEGAVSFKDLDLDYNYDEVIRYSGKNTPGSIQIDGITYAHYLVSGVMGRPVSGEHPAYSLLIKQFSSCTVGHIHTFDYCVRTRQDGSKVMGLSAGCFFDYTSEWAGETQKLYWPGVSIKRNVEKGQYDLETVSLERLRREYG